ncbi:hypothetical protein [Blastococcus sp. SYSU D00813]
MGPLLVASGTFTAALSAAGTGRALSAPTALLDTLLIASLSLHLIGMTWAISRLGILKALSLYAVSSVIVVLTAGSLDLADAWKYQLAWPLCVLATALAVRRGAVVNASVLLALSAVALVAESRNNAIVLVLAALVGLAPIARARLTASRLLVGLGVLAASMYVGAGLITSAIERGTFGEDLQDRQLEQAEDGPLGARVEYGASLALFLDDPFGFGLGVQPSNYDAFVAESGFYDIGVRPDTDYIQEEVLGGTFELHSIASDLWLLSGLGGLLYVVGMVWVCVRTLVQRGDGARSLRWLLNFLAFQSLWDILFSPLPSNGRWLLVSLAAILMAAPSSPRIGQAESAERNIRRSPQDVLDDELGTPSSSPIPRRHPS